MARTRYKCTACNWRFSRNFAPQLCPNCGKQSLQVDESSGAAEDLLKEADRF